MCWHPKELKNVAQTDADFNNFLWTVDNLGTLVDCWMDNGMRVWRDEGKVEVAIPDLINDYNHWMCDADIANQQILYYHPDFCCI
eukprot:14266982-Ditylum_brightwellii.AAC.1